MNYTDAWLDLGFSVRKDATTKHPPREVDPIDQARAARLRESALTTAWFWKKKGLNALADALPTAKNEEA
jgi:predicted chitinase